MPAWTCSTIGPESARARLTVTAAGTASGDTNSPPRDTEPARRVPASDPPVAAMTPGLTVIFLASAAAEVTVSSTVADAAAADGPVNFTVAPVNVTPCGDPATASAKSVPKAPPENTNGTLTVSPARTFPSSDTANDALSVTFEPAPSTTFGSTSTLNKLKVPTSTGSENTVSDVPPPSV